MIGETPIILCLPNIVDGISDPMNLYKETIENKSCALLFTSLPPHCLNLICPPASFLRSPFHHRLSVPVCSPSNTPSRQHWSPGDVSLLRSDVVGYANRPSRPLLLTRPGLHFSKPTETQRRSTSTQKVQKKTHTRETRTGTSLNSSPEISRHCMFSYVGINVATTTFDLTLIW